MADEPESAPDLKGHRLDEMAGVTVGRVEGTFVDEVSGRAEWLLARMGRFGHYCLVPGRDAVAANGHVWVPYSRDQIRKAPRVDPKQSLNREVEQAMLDHYGVGSATTGRGAELLERGPQSATARPSDL